MPAPSLAHITGTAYAVGQTGATQTYAPAGIRIYFTPVSVSGQAIYSGRQSTTVGASGAVDFYVVRGATVHIEAPILGFNDGENVQIPDSANVSFESLVAITVTPATFGNPMTTPGDLIYGSTGGSATRLAIGNEGQVLSIVDGLPVWADVAGAGLGTVTSVGLSLPNIFTVTNSPVTGSGTLTGVLATQSANRIFAGPSTGSAAAPTFRALVAADVPDLSSVYEAANANIQSHISSTANPHSVTASQVGLGSVLNAAQLVAANNLSDLANAGTARTNLGLAIGSNVQAFNQNLADIAALADPNADRLLFWDDSAGAYKHLTLGTNLSITGTTIDATGGGGSGADTALSNLASVAINTSLISDTDATDDLGSSLKKWKDGYFAGVVWADKLRAGSMYLQPSAINGSTMAVLAGDFNTYRSMIAYSFRLGEDDSNGFDAGIGRDIASFTQFISAGGGAGGFTLNEMGSNPAAPIQDTQLHAYLKGDKLVFQFNNGGTTRYFTLDLTQNGATATIAQSTSAP